MDISKEIKTINDILLPMTKEEFESMTENDFDLIVSDIIKEKLEENEDNIEILQVFVNAIYEHLNFVRAYIESKILLIPDELETIEETIESEKEIDVPKFLFEMSRTQSASYDAD